MALHFSSTDFFEDSHMIVAEEIWNSCPYIEWLSLVDCSLTDEELSNFLRFLVGHPTINNLECRCRFSSNTATALAEMIQDSDEVLETLVLSEVPDF